MSKQTYDWKRFWCPREGTVNLADGGYLYDPDAEWGRACNPDLVSLDSIYDVPCLVLLGEPGIGKSRELDKLKTFTDTKICNSNQTLALNLRTVTNLKEDLFKEETFINWLQGSYRLYLFLDSLDEGLLSIPTLATGLVDEFKKPKYQNHFGRLHLRLACRTFVFPTTLEEGIKDLWKETNLAIYELSPLRRTDVIKAAEIEGLSSDIFLNEIYQKDIIPLAIKPITLMFLLKIYHRNNGRFPPDQKLHELYRDGCNELCTEQKNVERHPLRPVSNLQPENRLIVSARIATITIFSNLLAVWSGKKVNMPNEDIFLNALCYGYENINGNSFEITDKVINEVLDTGLFSSRGLNRMGWAHQTYAEFLAAWYLTHNKIPLAKIMELICSSEDPNCRLIPQLHQTVAWLASMNLMVLEKIIKIDPDVLLQTDVPTDAKVRAAIVDSLLAQYEEGKLFDKGLNNYRHYAKLRHPGLVEQLRPYIANPGKQDIARDLAIDIAESCKISELQNELAELALDSTQSIYLRVSAANAICSIGNAATRLRLKPLAIEQLSEDTDDQLKGYALKAVWPDHLTVEELFQVLTRPKKKNVGGGYQWFLIHELVPKLRPEYLVVALDWLQEQGLRCFGNPFEELGNALLLKAWENFDLPDVAESFTKVALVQWKQYESIISHNIQRQEQFASSLLHDSQKRHTLVEQAVLAVSGTGEQPFFLLSSLTDNILEFDDVFWMLEKLQTSNDEEAQKIWAQLITWNFNHQDVKQIDAIIAGTHVSNVLQECVSPYFAPIELNSPQADEQRNKYVRMEEMQAHNQNPPLLDPPPIERILQYLGRLESGDLSAWWHLNMEMTLKPDSQHYENQFELDLTQLPGWKEADETTRKRIIEGAKKYVQEKVDVDHSWIGTNSFDRSTLAGCKALHLLLTESLDFLENLPLEAWQRWAPVIIAAPNSNQHEAAYLELVKYAFLNAPENSIKTLMALIDQENQEHDNLFVIDKLDKCWNKQLILALLEKAKDPSLKPKCIGELLDKLLKQGLSEVEDFAKSLIAFPPISTDNERRKALIASSALVENSNPSSWSFMWAIIQQDSSLGQEIFELVVQRNMHDFQLNLTETQLADLYIWLVHEYPYDEDPDHSNVMEYSLTARDGIVRLRDGVLSQLKERGTLDACTEVERLIQELPDITWLGKILIDAQANMRRKTWHPMSPEDLIQFLTSNEPSNSDLSNQIDVIDQRTKKMEDEPKIENRISFSNSPHSSINAPVGTSGITNSNVTKASSDNKKGVNWHAVIATIVTVVGLPLTMSVSGAFNDEFKEWFNRIFSYKVEQQPVLKSK
jgi:predicted NACHT family NTPase